MGRADETGRAQIARRLPSSFLFTALWTRLEDRSQCTRHACPGPLNGLRTRSLSASRLTRTCRSRLLAPLALALALPAFIHHCHPSWPTQNLAVLILRLLRVCAPPPVVFLQTDTLSDLTAMTTQVPPQLPPSVLSSVRRHPSHDCQTVTLKRRTNIRMYVPCRSLTHIHSVSFQHFDHAPIWNSQHVLHYIRSARRIAMIAGHRRQPDQRQYHNKSTGAYLRTGGPVGFCNEEPRHHIHRRDLLAAIAPYNS